MRGRSSDYAAPPVYLTSAAPRRGVRFSRTELFQLAVAILGLSAAFTVLFIRYSIDAFTASPLGFLLVYFPTSLLAVGTGVGLHEIMHKIVAQRYGHWAEFRYDLRGILLAFVFAAVGFIFGAPGATYISGMVTREQNGRISLAGPATNIALSVLFLGGTLALLTTPATVLDEILFNVLFEVAVVNGILAAFNMLPIMPLDGAKVWAWNKGIYAVTMAVAILLAIVAFDPALIL